VSLDWTPPTLETKRLILRPIVPDDTTAVFMYASNPNVTRFTLFETHQTVEDSRWFAIDYVRSRYACKEPDPFAIVISISLPLFAYARTRPQSEYLLTRTLVHGGPVGSCGPSI